MLPVGAPARARLLRRHTGDLERLCLLSLGDPAAAAAASSAALERGATALDAGRRPEDGRTWLLAIGVRECARRAAAEDAGDAWDDVRRLPSAPRTALILHEGVGLGVRATARALGVDWRAATDLLFAGRQALAQAAGAQEPLACTAHRRRLSDAGCRGAGPARSRAHLASCEGCRGMLQAAAERRRADGPSRPIPAPAPRARRRLLTARRALAAGAGLTAVAVAALALSGGLPPSPSPAPPEQAAAGDPVPATAALTRATPRAAAHRAAPSARRVRRRLATPRLQATVRPALPGGLAAPAPVLTAAAPAAAGAASTTHAPVRGRVTRRPAPSPRPPAVPRRARPSRPAPASPPADVGVAAPAPAPPAPAPADPPPAAATEPAAPATPDPATTTPPAPVTPPPDPGPATGGTTTAPAAPETTTPPAAGATP